MQLQWNQQHTNQRETIYNPRNEVNYILWWLIKLVIQPVVLIGLKVLILTHNSTTLLFSVVTVHGTALYPWDHLQPKVGPTLSNQLETSWHEPL